MGDDKIAPMRRLTWVYGLAALLLITVAAGLIYRLPPVYNRLSWRVDFALTSLRTKFDPIEPLPTALPAPEILAVQAASPTPAATATLQPTPSPEMPPTATLTPTALPAAIALTPPKWEKQDINNCGPAALTMYLRYYGWEGDQETITRVIKPYREDRNVNVEELAYYVRTQAGWLNAHYRVAGDLELLKRLIAAGLPVMIEESFYFDEPYWSGDDLWAAHYQVLTGYDEASQTFIGQDSFYGPDLRISYEKLNTDWQTFNRLYILIYPTDREETVKQILGERWDEDFSRQLGLKTALAETEADPENAFAWFNLGSNLTYFERYIEATDAYDKAREMGLPQRMLRYQFSPFIAYFHTGQLDDLMALADYALKVTPNSEEALLWHGWGMYRQGDVAAAVKDFQQALIENPNYQDAQYALDFARENP